MKDIVRENLKRLTSPEAREVALSESVGGNAGPSCYALNLWVEGSGEILHIGNVPDQVNATLRVYVPFFSARSSKLNELAIEVWGDIPEAARRQVSRSAWLWNLHRENQERALLEEFSKGKITFESLVELLRSKFPRLAEELGS